MSHQFTTGFFAEKAAWHGLGTVLPEGSDTLYDVELALQASGCGFHTKKVPTFINVNGEVRETGHYATVRTDTGAILGNVGERYQVLQTVEQFSWFQPFLDTKEVSFEACMALRGGSVVSVLARIQREDEKVGNDHIRKYLLLASSHDGSLATNVGYSPVRVVCMNTLKMSISDANSALFKIRHTKNQHAALTQVQQTIDLIDREFKATAEQYQKLADCGIKMDDLQKYVKLVLGVKENEEISTRKKNIMDNIVRMAISGIGQSGDERDLSYWTAYQGVTEYVTHVAGRTEENRFISGNFGVNSQLNQKALDLALRLAN